MPTRDEHNPDTDNPHLPDELAQRLSAMHDGHLFVPPDTDRAVLERAREHFGVKPDTNRRLWLRFAAPLAAAAMIALGVWTVWPNAGQPGQFVQGDADRSGTVDILDAFAMARVIDAGQPAPANWDMTGDGRVDREDVSAVAAIAVSLSGHATDSGAISGGVSGGTSS